MGTMLQSSGLRPGENAEVWNLTQPERIERVHRAYLAAGSQVIYANTFGANRLKLKKTGHTPDEIIAAGLRAARHALQGTGALAALDVGPLGALLEPLGTLTFEEAYDLFAEMMVSGQRHGADLIVIETMTDLYEAKAALLAAKENTALPVFVTMSFDANGRTFTGCTAASMARVLEGLGADAVGVNCSLGPREMLPVIREIRRHTRLPLIAKPNAGLPDPVDGRYSLSAADFAADMEKIAGEGVTILGGCCGTDPDYIRALSGLSPAAPAPDAFRPCSFLCTPTVPLPIDRVRVIGERINPTGKKRFQQALLENDLDYIVDTAIQQMDAGAEILDVNVGYPGVEEKTMLPRVVKALQAAVDIPLQLDSADPEALEAGLRVYNGKASVNSVNGDPQVLGRILPLVKKYGAAVVGLTLDEAGLPDTAQRRLAIARRILDSALALGIPREDVWIDCLTLTVSAQQEQAAETLKAVETVSRQWGLQTVLGVSNISFGLPNRSLVTRAFLAQALRCGLTLPIVNPAETMDMIAACRVLGNEDEQSRRYVARFAALPEKTAAPGSRMTLEEAVQRGFRAEAGALAREALKEQDEMELVECRLIPALDQVGADYERGAVFLPQLLSAAQAAQAVFEVIRASLLQKGRHAVSKGAVLIATVQGDIHDIGKNIVKTVLENYGYTVIDLGKDVKPEIITRRAAETGASLVGLSALMTTTLPAMEETVRQLKALPHPPRIMVGGAVVTSAYAEKIGADFYARDARAAVEAARQVFG